MYSQEAENYLQRDLKLNGRNSPKKRELKTKREEEWFSMKKLKSTCQDGELNPKRISNQPLCNKKPLV